MLEVERFTQDGYTVRIIQDPDPMDPRDADHLGVMYCQHSRYTLGDVAPVHSRHIPEWDLIDTAWSACRQRGYPSTVFIRWLHMCMGARVVLPLYLFDHSGLAMSTGTYYHVDPQGWDWGMVGVIFDLPRTREETGYAPDLIAEVLENEVREYSAWLEGEVYGYVVERYRTCNLGHQHVEELDSCWGYIITDEKDMDELREEARHSATYHHEMEED